MSEYIPDMTQRFPDAGEPAEEKEYTINAWTPVQIQMDVYGTSEEDAIRNMRQMLLNGTSAAKWKVVDRDFSELSDIEIE